jgi:hypothetical protein
VADGTARGAERRQRRGRDGIGVARGELQPATTEGAVDGEAAARGGACEAGRDGTLAGWCVVCRRPSRPSDRSARGG